MYTTGAGLGKAFSDCPRQKNDPTTQLLPQSAASTRIPRCMLEIHEMTRQPHWPQGSTTGFLLQEGLQDLGGGNSVQALPLLAFAQADFPQLRLGPEAAETLIL